MSKALNINRVTNLTKCPLRLTYWKPTYQGMYLDTNIEVLIESNTSVDLPTDITKYTDFVIVSNNYSYDVLKFGSYGIRIIDPDIEYKINNLALEILDKIDF